MPVRYVIHKELRLVVSVGEGTLTIDELKAQQNRLLNDPDFDPTFDHFNDYTAVTGADMSVDELRAYASRQVFSPTSRRAVVARQPAVFGLSRVFEVWHEERSQVGVFYDRNEALKWLGLRED